MREFVGKTYWLVGASEGLGAALAQILSRAGAEVILSARNGEKLSEVAAALPGPSRSCVMDIASGDSVAQAAKQVGPVDGLVLLAGVYWPFSARNWNATQAVAMADVNFTGYMRVLGHVIPDMVARDDGHIVITSSLTAYRGLPGSIGYTAAKAATLSLAECMYADLRKTGVNVQVANPGFIQTGMTEKNTFRMPQLMRPEQAAAEMFDLMNSDAFKKNFPLRLSTLIRAAQFLPDALYYKLFA